MSDTIVVALIAAVPPTLVAAVAVYATLVNAHKITELHILLNSNLDKWVASATKAAIAEGHAAGVEDERNRG